MARYWIKIDGSVEGPYDGRLLRFMDGFSRETMVSPEGAGKEELWFKVTDRDELKSIFGGTGSDVQTVPGPRPQAAPKPQPALSEKVELELPKKELLPIPETKPETAQEQIDRIPLVPEPENQPAEKIKDSALEKPPGNISGADQGSPSSMDNDILQVMDKISEELAKHKSVPEVKPVKKAEPVARQQKKPETLSMLWVSVIIILLGVGSWALYTFVLSEKSTKMESVNTEKLSGPPEKEAQKTESPAEIKKAKNLNNPKPANAVSKPVPAKKKNSGAPKPPPVPAPSKPQEQELKTQRYLLPGVPAPNIAPEKIPPSIAPDSAPSEESKPAPQDKEKPKKELKEDRPAGQGVWD